MTPLGWLFMGTAWAVVGGLVVYCFGRLLRHDGASRHGR
jgi:hypothetical protein